MKRIALPPQTVEGILDAAFRAIVTKGASDATLSAIASEAGVSRQSVYLAFGNRTGLLAAMLDWLDGKNAYPQHMADIAAGTGSAPGTLLAFVEAWLMHLPDIQPVAVLLRAAAVMDGEAAEAFERHVSGPRHAALLTICNRLAANGHLARGLSPDRAADTVWSFVHVDTWQHLVRERGWTADDFREDRLALIEATVLR